MNLSNYSNFLYSTTLLLGFLYFDKVIAYGVLGGVLCNTQNLCR